MTATLPTTSDTARLNMCAAALRHVTDLYVFPQEEITSVRHVGEEADLQTDTSRSQQDVHNAWLPTFTRSNRRQYVE